jgi:hypothetical protein
MTTKNGVHIIQRIVTCLKVLRIYLVNLNNMTEKQKRANHRNLFTYEDKQNTKAFWLGVLTLLLVEILMLIL